MAAPGYSHQWNTRRSQSVDRTTDPGVPESKNRLQTERSYSNRFHTAPMTAPGYLQLDGVVLQPLCSNSAQAVYPAEHASHLRTFEASWGYYHHHAIPLDPEFGCLLAG